MVVSTHAGTLRSGRYDTTPVNGRAGRAWRKPCSRQRASMLTITEDGIVKPPLFRVMSLFMSKTATIDAFLKELETR